MDLSIISIHSLHYLLSITPTLIGSNSSLKHTMKICIVPLIQGIILSMQIDWWPFGRIDLIDHSHLILTIWLEEQSIVKNPKKLKAISCSRWRLMTLNLNYSSLMRKTLSLTKRTSKISLVQMILESSSNHHPILEEVS